MSKRAIRFSNLLERASPIQIGRSGFWEGSTAGWAWDSDPVVLRVGEIAGDPIVDETGQELVDEEVWDGCIVEPSVWGGTEEVWLLQGIWVRTCRRHVGGLITIRIG